MLGAKRASRPGVRASRGPGLMSTSRTEDSQLKTFLLIVSGFSLVCLFALVVIRSQLLATVSSLSDDLEAKKGQAADLRKRLSDMSGQLNSERRRLADLTVERDQENAESTHTIEILRQKLDHTQTQVQTCHDEHADTRGTGESIKRELTIELEECRADVTDLQKDLSTVQSSLKQQQSHTLDWKDSYDSEFKSHAITQRTLTDLRAELRELKDSCHASRSSQHGHPPSPGGDGQPPAERAAAVGSERSGPPGEVQQPKRHAAHTQNRVSEDPPVHHRIEHIDLDDDPLDRPHYHYEVPNPDELGGNTGDAHPGRHGRDYHGDVPVHVETHRNEGASVYMSDYELLHMHYHHMHGHGSDGQGIQDEPQGAVSDLPMDSLSSDAEVDPVGGSHHNGPEAGEVPPVESLRIHRMRHRSHAEPVPVVDPAEYEETLS